MLKNFTEKNIDFIVRIEVMNKLKEKGLIKDYAIGGAIAALKWVEPFFTQDLDIFVILEKEANKQELIILSPIYEYLKNKGYIWEKHWIIIDGVPVDIFPADILEKKAIEEAIDIEYEEIKTKVMTFLRTNREKDKRKIQMLLDQTEINIKKLNKILTDHDLKERFIKFQRRYYEK